jgi:transcription termination/antitermination protein NusG
MATQVISEDHPMADEQNTHLGEATSDGGRSLDDDAVSGRSDDTALDESSGIPSTGRNGVSAERAAEPADDDAAADQPLEPEAAEEIDQADQQDDETDEELIEAEEKPGRVPIPPVAINELPPEEIRMDWYILKVQSNRERSIAEALERKMRIEGLDRFFDQVIVPTEKVTEFKGGKKKVVERKLYPGYIVVHMHINDDTWFAVRETSGVGDFTGAGGKPTPMLAHEVSRIIQTEEEETTEAPKLDIRFSSGDKVKVKEGNFENFEGEVNTIDEASGRVTVMINIFGRSTPVELEYWQIEAV